MRQTHRGRRPTVERKKGDEMTNQQKATIARLAGKLGLGGVQQAIKSVLGKMPINMSASRADSVIAELQSRWEATEEYQAEQYRYLGEDMPFLAR